MKKIITYKFTDGSEIDIHEEQRATISGHTKQFSFQLWTKCRVDVKMKPFWTDMFIQICEEMHKRHGIVLEHTDYRTGITVNHFENLIA